MKYALTLVAVLAMVLTGCQGGNPFSRSSDQPEDFENFEGIDDFSTTEVIEIAEPGLAIAMQLRFDDVPVPADARQDIERTYVFESADLQIGRMVFTSKASTNELAQFYLKECPAADWTLESVIQADGAELLFKKPGKRLTVSIRSQRASLSGRLLIINLTPDATGGSY